MPPQFPCFVAPVAEGQLGFSTSLWKNDTARLDLRKDKRSGPANRAIQESKHSFDIQLP
jgi:hypothetical protein